MLTVSNVLAVPAVALALGIWLDELWAARAEPGADSNVSRLAPPLVLTFPDPQLRAPERVDPAGFGELGEVLAAIRSGVPVAVVTVVAAGADPAGRLGRRMVVWADRTAGSLGAERLDAAAVDDARGLLASGRSATLRYGYDGQRRGDELTCFVAAFATPPRMLVVGAIDFAAAVARIGGFPAGQTPRLRDPSLGDQ